jgi:hypothetical protein
MEAEQAGGHGPTPRHVAQQRFEERSSATSTFFRSPTQYLEWSKPCLLCVNNHVPHSKPRSHGQDRSAALKPCIHQPWEVPAPVGA